MEELHVMDATGMGILYRKGYWCEARDKDGNDIFIFVNPCDGIVQY